ncbi:MAG: UvrD-helicase domain-containing protein [Ignavibacteriales bacterium]|nr:UvrD-helicase domain-containing protein [Ignavibacteriales bacterium]MCF8315348.1 UvrD-helicase domain-containing protein [Ignavibacteriales bacterium]MCF8436760.1 UvrD-helicase domain-containing protein [Ignavibacteriales bacterium]
MRLTEEQLAIINSSGNIKINAVAGSGKTTTIIEYAKLRSPDSRILYLAFNRSVRFEARKKFQAAGLKNVTIETAHSLAYRYIKKKSTYTLRVNGYKIYEIASLLGLKGNGDKHAELIVANHIKKFISIFCNSNASKVNQINYLDFVTDPEARKFVAAFYKYILEQTRLLLAKMDSGEIDVTHDFYLKKFQLSQPELNYDYILFDEGQDASPAMLDVFLRQKAVKVIVGDSNQQIYGWRNAVNSLEMVYYPVYTLSNSFRFGGEIAALASDILDMKKLLFTHEKVKITGSGAELNSGASAYLGRTNLGLLIKAIEQVESHKLKSLYFEGNFNSYTYAEEGTSLYDVLNLSNGENDRIRDALLKSMSDLSELEEYVEKTDDLQLGMLLEIVREYGNSIPRIIKSIKDLHVEDSEKEKAEMIFSTVHKCKGMEYSQVYLVEDFITGKKLRDIINSKDESIPEIEKLNEEINLLYVAITRAKNKLYIPESLLPDNYPSSQHIQKLPSRQAKSTRSDSRNEGVKGYVKDFFKFDKTDDSPALKSTAFKDDHHWTNQQVLLLQKLHAGGSTLRQISKILNKSPGAIQIKLNKLRKEGL